MEGRTISGKSPKTSHLASFSENCTLFVRTVLSYCNNINYKGVIGGFAPYGGISCDILFGLLGGKILTVTTLGKIRIHSVNIAQIQR